MPLVEQNTITQSSGHHRCNYGVSAKDLLKFISSLLLPLMLGVFTIIITLQQQRVATEQRIQDRNDSAQQRAEDRQMALEQREQDKQIAKEQRAQDERRREQDLKIARDKRDHDDKLAAKQRDMLEKQRAHELAVEDARYDKETAKYLDALLVNYINEIGTLFINNNGNLTSNPTISILVRSKTLTIARQLDPPRSTQLVQFLYEAGQLMNGRSPLDLSGVNLNGIDLSSTIQQLPMHRLSLFGAHLSNASFKRRDLSNANFSSAHLKGVSFVDTYLEHVDFSHAILWQADFEDSVILHTSFNSANMVHAKFSHTKISNSHFMDSTMRGINITGRSSLRQCSFTNIRDLNRMNLSYIDFGKSKFTNVDLRDTLFIGATVHWTDFIKTQLDGSDFSYSDCKNSHFEYLNLNRIAFVRTSLRETLWTGSTLTNIDYTGADLRAANFEGTIKLENLSFVAVEGEKIIFTDTKLKTSNFSGCRCNAAVFNNARISDVSFNNAVMNYANFSGATMSGLVTFHKIDGLETDFSQSDVTWCDFSQSRLIGASFACCGADYTNSTGTEVTGVDFSDASIEHAYITKEQLDAVMSLSTTYFHRKAHRNPNLIMNNGYECSTNTTVNKTLWQVIPRPATVMMFSESDMNCSFTASQPLLMSQVINISRYQRLIDKGRARGHISTTIWNISTILYVTTVSTIEFTRNHSFRE